MNRLVADRKGWKVGINGWDGCEANAVRGQTVPKSTVIDQSTKKENKMKCKLSVYSLDQGTKPTAELITAQKPFVMLRATDMLENHDILMMDADTAVIGSLTEILETRKIYKILSREKHFSQRLTKGDCRKIYKGLVFIGGSKEEKKPFYTLG